MKDGYQILDEPRPGRLAHLAVQPLWPLFSIMFGGAWICWPWFVLNAFAVGSPTRVRELLWAVGGFVGTFLLALGLGILNVQGLVDDVTLRYLVVLILVWKLTVSYWLYILQSRTFALYRYFGGPVRSGLLVVIASALLRGPLLASLPGIFVTVMA